LARRWWWLLLATLPSLATAQLTGASFDWQLPRGFPTPFVPADNPMSVAKVALGRRLFFETRLSVTGHYSCASCHDPARSYTDGRARALGATGAVMAHSSMALINVAYNLSYGWQHPQISSLEAQMRQPLFNRHPVEIGMAGRDHEVRTALAADATYVQQFAAVFGGAISVARCSSRAASVARAVIPVSISPATGAIARARRARPASPMTGWGSGVCAYPRCAISY
jgi:cytochrome c peroxidase